jgi:hypothetical protein
MIVSPRLCFLRSSPFSSSFHACSSHPIDPSTIPRLKSLATTHNEIVHRKVAWDRNPLYQLLHTVAIEIGCRLMLVNGSWRLLIGGGSFGAGLEQLFECELFESPPYNSSAMSSFFFFICSSPFCTLHLPLHALSCRSPPSFLSAPSPHYAQSQYQTNVLPNRHPPSPPPPPSPIQRGGGRSPASAAWAWAVPRAGRPTPV